MKLLPLVFLVALTVVTAVHGRAIRLRRSSSYYANESACIVDDVAYFNGDPVPSSDPCEECKCRTPGFVCTITECEEKEGCQRIKVPGECCSYKCDKPQSEEVAQGRNDEPVTTTVAPTGTVSEAKDNEQERVHEAEKERDHQDSGEEQTDHLPITEDPTRHVKEERAEPSPVSTEADEPKSEVVTTIKPPELEVDVKKDEQQEKPEVSQSEQRDQRPSKRSELPASIGLIQESTSTESSPKQTEEPQSSTKQESDDSDKKLEAVTEARKEGRSSSDKPQLEVTSPASEEPSSSSSQEPEKTSEGNVENGDQKHDHVTLQPEHSVSTLAGHSSEQGSPSIENRHSLEQKPDPEKENPEAEKDEKHQPEQVSSEEKSSEEESANDSPSTESSSEESKDGHVHVVVVSSTPPGDKQESREAAILIPAEKRESEGKEEQDSDLKPKEEEASSHLPVTDSQSTVTPSVSPAEESKEEGKESTPPAKSSPSKRFADWVDYVPRGFQA